MGLQEAWWYMASCKICSCTSLFYIELPERATSLISYLGSIVDIHPHNMIYIFLLYNIIHIMVTISVLIDVNQPLLMYISTAVDQHQYTTACIIDWK